MTYYLCLIAIFFIPHFSSAMKKQVFPLKNELKMPIIALLDEAVDLHQAIYFKKEDQVRLALSKIIKQIKMIEDSYQLLPYHQQSYIYKLLQDLKPTLENIKSSSMKNRAEYINTINRTVSHLSHIYGLKQKYAVFFCRKDRSTWIQSKSQKHNKKPLHLEHSSCGNIINK